MASNGMVDISVFGNKELEKALHKLPTAVQRKLTKESLKRGADIVLQAAKTRVHRLTGLLANTIFVKKMKSHGGTFGWVVMTPTREMLAGTKAQTAKGYYPQHLEYGSKHQPPYPYMRPAADENLERVLAEIEAGLAAELEAM